MFYQVRQYLKFILQSTNQHGVHSPFVYSLVTKCFYDKTKHTDYKELSAYRKSLKQNHTEIKVTDLGAGSRVMKSKTRKVSSITKKAGTSKKRTLLLYRLSNYFKPSNILELGTSLGISTQALALGSPNGQITSIEGCPNTLSFTINQFKSRKLKNINFLNGSFNEEIKTLTSNKYDLIFFDGNHQKEPTLQYFKTLLKTAHNDSVFIFDDIYWSQGMTEAWEIIKKHPQVTVTIDTFYWGLVFFRKEQLKEHFKIRV